MSNWWEQWLCIDKKCTELMKLNTGTWLYKQKQLNGRFYWSLCLLLCIAMLNNVYPNAYKLWISTKQRIDEWQTNTFLRSRSKDAGPSKMYVEMSTSKVTVVSHDIEIISHASMRVLFSRLKAFKHLSLASVMWQRRPTEVVYWVDKSHYKSNCWSCNSSNKFNCLVGR